MVSAMPHDRVFESRDAATPGSDVGPQERPPALKASRETDQITLENLVRELLSQKFLIRFENGVGNQTNLLEAGLLDSYALIELVLLLDQTYLLSLTDDDLVSADITSVSGMARLIAERHASALNTKVEAS
jgi:acyl carrier protein